MMATGNEEGFKVTDRRRRVEEDPTPRREAPVAPSSPPPEAPPPEAPVEGRTLIGLFMMLASSALVALGEAPDPITGERHHDLGNAADVIDMLILLRERTEGRRLPEETQVLEQLIYDLQVSYVSATRRSG